MRQVAPSLLADFFRFKNPDGTAPGHYSHSNPFLAFRNSDCEFVTDVEALAGLCRKSKRPE
jgi:hypothetical protein